MRISAALDSSGYLPIEQYAVIGNGQSAALVSIDGSIDWWCPPRFDQPSVFGALLDSRRGGRFVVRPAVEFSCTRRYVDSTNVLETTFAAAGGVVRLTDAMPIVVGAAARQLRSAHTIVRVIECLEGEVEVDVRYEPRFDYGLAAVRVENRGGAGFCTQYRGNALAVRSDFPMELRADGAAVSARVRLTRGASRTLALTFARNEPLVIPPLGEHARAAIANTIGWWGTWAAQCKYSGPYAEHVIRSALVLKLMAFAPSGAIVAAPTTSLPEEIGGVRNWDYRYCWLRDATMTVRALLDLGFAQEGEAFLVWLLHATRLTWPRLRVMYDVFGRPTPGERTVQGLTGYQNSSPVRTGNAAVDQLQLDVYGQVSGAARAVVEAGLRLSRAQARSLVDLGEMVCQLWREPDEGIWEIRSGRRQHTYSKVMCWVALDDLLALHAAGVLHAPVERFERERDAIRRAIETHGYNSQVRSYTGAFGAEHVDASLLLLPLHRYIAPDAPRMLATYTRIIQTLSHNGLLRRYPAGSDDGIEGVEGMFAICAFWLVRYRAMLGDMAGARAEFERLLSFANDVGLFAEQLDPRTGAALGNFPQAFTHIGLINAALALNGV